VRPLVRTRVGHLGRPACLIGSGDDVELGGAVMEALRHSRRLPTEVRYDGAPPQVVTGLPLPDEYSRFGYAEAAYVDLDADGITVLPLTGDVSVEEDRKVAFPATVGAEALGTAVREAVELAVGAPLARVNAPDEIVEGWIWPTLERLLEVAQAAGDREPVGERVRALAERLAVELELPGFTPAGVRELDARFDDGWPEDGEDDLLAAGAYVGEVLRRQLGGRWEGDLGLRLRLALRRGDMVWPVERALSRYQEGREASLVAYAYVLGLTDGGTRTGRRPGWLRLPRLGPFRDHGPQVRVPPDEIAREVVVAVDGDSLLVWPVFMYALVLVFGRPIERIPASSDAERIGNAVRQALDAVRYADAKTDRDHNVDPLFEAGSFARDAGLGIDEDTFFDTMVAASVWSDPSHLRTEPWLPQPESGGLEPATWLAVERAEPVTSEQLGQDLQAALDAAAVQRKRLAELGKS
jgi:hypothetical protein